MNRRNGVSPVAKKLWRTGRRIGDEAWKTEVRSQDEQSNNEQANYELEEWQFLSNVTQGFEHENSTGRDNRTEKS